MFEGVWLDDVLDWELYVDYVVVIGDVDVFEM